MPRFEDQRRGLLCFGLGEALPLGLQTGDAFLVRLLLSALGMDAGPGIARIAAHRAQFPLPRLEQRLRFFGIHQSSRRRCALSAALPGHSLVRTVEKSNRDDAQRH